ncbi:hypothetical protein D082_25300 [Synechocystis sp. PCC 6714]|nr:hypothetical protein D082_25300 [Synechocystis sp. PCC 6714]
MPILIDVIVKNLYCFNSPILTKTQKKFSPPQVKYGDINLNLCRFLSPDGDRRIKLWI